MWLLTKTQHCGPIQQSTTYCPFDDGEVIVYVGLNMLLIQKTVTVRVLYNNQPHDTTISYMVEAQVSFQHKGKALQRN